MDTEFGLEIIITAWMAVRHNPSPTVSAAISPASGIIAGQKVVVITTPAICLWLYRGILPLPLSCKTLVSMFS